MKTADVRRWMTVHGVFATGATVATGIGYGLRAHEATQAADSLSGAGPHPDRAPPVVTETRRPDDPKIQAPSELPAASVQALTAETAKDDDLAPDRDTLSSLNARLDQEQAERRRLEQELAALRDRIGDLEREWSASATIADEPGDNNNESPDGENDRRGLDEECLVAAGFNTERAQYIKRRVDEQALDRLYLRDQAIRENWIDSPRYAEALRKLSRGEGSLRRELDEQSYGALRFASGQVNRVSVDTVIDDSAAQQVGLEPRDVIYRYDGARIFAPDDLRFATTAGAADEPVTVEVVRDGVPVEFEIPRGPLGVRINATSEAP